MFKRLHLSALAATAVTTFTFSAAAQFTPGDVYYGASTGEVVNATAGGDLTGQILADTVIYSAGQLAWSEDLTELYVSHINDGYVDKIDSQGNILLHADGLSGPTGLLRTSDGTLLVAEFMSGEITDITAGGDFTNAAPLADGLSGPRNLAQMPGGTVYVADQFLDGVYDINYPAGGTVGLPFADGLNGLRTLAVADDGTLYACRQGFVYDITAGGNFSNAAAYAQGQSFASLTISGSGQLLSGEIFGTVLWDITGGGDFSGATPWATGLPSGETGLGTVPPAICGTGTTEGTEECDDGNDSNEDGCLDDCTLPTCGDTFVWAGMEECDDGNTDDGDGCSSTCQIEGMGTGGMGGTGGSGGSGGSTSGGTGGMGGSGGTTSGGSGGSGGSTSSGNNGADTTSSSGCAVSGPARGDVAWWALLGLIGAGAFRRRRRG